MRPNPVPRLSRTDYFRLSVLNLFSHNRAELVNGVVTESPARSNTFAVCSALLTDALRSAFGAECWVRTLAPLDLTEWYIPSPAVAVVNGSLASWHGRREHPTSALLVGEVSEDDIDYQRMKASLYAATGIADYWILNIPDGVLEIRRDPRPDATQDFGFGYATLSTLAAADFATPLAIPTARIPVADLLPG